MTTKKPSIPTSSNYASTSKGTLRAALTPQAMNKMDALKHAGSLTDQQKKEKNEQKAKRAKFNRTLRWLNETFPNCFSKDAPKPLKIKIEADLFTAIKENDEFSNLNIRNALSFYTSRLAYQESFLTHTHRVGLEGNDAEILEEQHLDHAKKRIEEIKERIDAAN